MTSKPDYHVAIIGTGFAGLGMAISLKKAGIDTFVLFEKAGDVGGTWRDNTYPGCACDVPSHLYSFSFEPNPNWSRSYPPQAELLAYLQMCAQKYGILPHIRFNAEIARAEFDEGGGFWRLETATGKSVTARVLVSGMGGLSRPSIPRIKGMETFQGRSFHSADWDHAYDLTDKNIAVIGTGASAVQFVPQIAPEVKRLHLFQRTPNWVIPRMDRTLGRFEKAMFKLLPATQRFIRNSIYCWFETRVLFLAVNPRLALPFLKLAGLHLRNQIGDPALRRILTPDYAIGCKRVLISDDYYPALTRDNVAVVTEGIAEIRPGGVVTKDGVEHPADAIIFSTGFKATDFITPVRILGKNGQDLNDAWRDGAEAHLGITVHGFPNLFLLVGPNTTLGHSSMVFMIESQVRFVNQALTALAQSNSNSLEVKAEPQRIWNAALQERMKKTVWLSGCQSWYLDASGKNTTLWPGFTFEYWRQTRRLNKNEYRFTKSAPLA